MRHFFMFAKAASSFFLNTLVLLASLWLPGKISAQQPGFFPKKAFPENGLINVYFNIPGRNDTIFQSRKHNILRPYINDSGKSIRANKRNHLSKNLSVEGSITLTINTTSTICGYSTGSIIVSATGGVPPYTYSITSYGYTFSQATGNFQNLSPYTYTITVSDANMDSASSDVTISNTFPPPSVFTTLSTPPTSCTAFDGALTLSASSGTPPYLYSLDNITYNSTGVFNNLSAGTYYMIVKDANGCVNTNSSVNFLNSLGNCFGSGFRFNYSVCNNEGVVTVTGYAGVPPYQFSLNGINYQSDQDFSNLSAGIHSVYIKDTTGKISIFSFTILPYCPLEIKVTDATCGQSNGQLTAVPSNGTAPFGYSLDGINYQTSNTFTNLAPGNYTITVKDANNITASNGGVIAEKCVTVSASAKNETCDQKNGSIAASAIDGVRPYQFSVDGIYFQDDSAFNGLAAGNYIVTVKDANGYTQTTQVTVKAECLQVAVTISNTTCSNANGSISISATNGAAPYQYSIDKNNFQQNNIFNGLTAGDYTLTIRDAANTEKDTSITINDSPSPTLNITVANASCNNANGSLTINANGGTASLLYSIDGITYQNTNTFSNLDSGKFFGYVKDINACVSTDTVYISALPAPTVFLGNDTSICDGSTLTLTAAQTAGNKYVWNDNTTAVNNVISKRGIYYVTVTNQFNCSASDTINISVRSVKNYTLGNDTSLCSGQIMILKPVPLIGGSYLWNTGASGSSITVSSAGSYWLQVTDSGCVKRDTININYIVTPVLYLGNDTTLCNGKTLLLNVANSGATYTWQDGSAQPIFMVNRPGLYSVKVSRNGCDTSGKIIVNYRSAPVPQLGADTVLCATQHLRLNAYYPQSTYLWQNGSTSSSYDVTTAGTYSVDVANVCGVTNASVSVSIKNCDCKFFIPSAFTPNYDGKNDLFKIAHQCFSDFSFKLFNRFGQLVFNSKNPLTSWDGSFNHEPQPTGVYVYQITYTDNLTGKHELIKGTVTLLR